MLGFSPTVFANVSWHFWLSNEIDKCLNSTPKADHFSPSEVLNLSFTCSFACSFCCHSTQAGEAFLFGGNKARKPATHPLPLLPLAGALGGSLFEYSTRRPSYVTALTLTKFNLMCVNLYVKQCTLLTPLPRTAAKNACEIACEGKIWNLRAEKWSAFGRGIIPFANSTLVNLIWQPKMPRGPPLTFAKMCTDQKKSNRWWKPTSCTFEKKHEIIIILLHR